ncbi:MAG TPA: cobalamin-dependent protein [Actinophytocola sp.]|nr:cobalamin-dependent protein [Actinophytocola sp.]
MGDAGRPRPLVLLSSVSSDSHTWNLVFLQLLLEETGHDVVNLGACVPDELLLSECHEHRPDAVVLSTVNGHGHADGRRLIDRLRADETLSDLLVVIGGKLGVSGSEDTSLAAELVMAGFDAAFPDGTGLDDFITYLGAALAIPAMESA